MEPSLRSSTLRGVECKLRRTDTAVHETMKRFVESLGSDMRISQYSDLHYATKRIPSDTWYWLEPLSGGRVGYLIFLPNQPAIWIDEQFKQSFKIQLRVSSSVYEKTSMFIASLNQTSCTLRLEDAWIIGGTSYLANIPFTQRWKALLDFYTEDFKEDRKLSQGLEILPAKYFPLHDIKKIFEKEIPVMLFAQGEQAARRLRVQMKDAEKRENNKAIVPPFFYADKAPEAKKVFLAKRVPEAKKANTPEKALFVEDDAAQGGEGAGAVCVAKAVAHDEYPDTYHLWIGGVKKGYAAVQDIDLSRCLREAAKGKKEVLVKVEWNGEFNMYQILSQA